MFHIISYVITVTTCVANALMSPVAVVGNALVLVAIWKNHSLRTPSFILLGGLAITDFLIGLIILPFLVASTVVELLNKVLPNYCILNGILFYGISSYLGLNAIFVVTLMSIERWMHMSRSSMVTVARTYKAYIVICLLPIPIVVSRLAKSLDGCISLREEIVEGIVVFLGLLIIAIFYFKVWKIIVRHQSQVHASQQFQNIGGQPSIDLAKYKRSVIRIFYIVGMFTVCYLPSSLFVIVRMFYENFQLTVGSNLASLILLTLYFLSSSLNPLIYCWRIRVLRVKIKQLLMTVFHQNV